MTLEEARRSIHSSARCMLINAMRERGVDCKYIAKRTRRQAKTVRAQLFGIDPLTLRTIAEFSLALGFEPSVEFVPREPDHG